MQSTKRANERTSGCGSGGSRSSGETRQRRGGVDTYKMQRSSTSTTVQVGGEGEKERVEPYDDDFLGLVQLCAFFSAEHCSSTDGE